MDVETIKQILDEAESKWEGDNVYKGMQIIAKYTEKIVRDASHDIIFCGDVEECIKAGMTRKDVIELGKLNWMVDEWGHGFSTFV